MLFAGAVISRIKKQFSVNCDSSHLAETIYTKAEKNLFDFIKKTQASHYQRLMGLGLEKDIHYCLTPDIANVLPEYADGKLIVR